MHATAQEAWDRTMQMLEVYGDFFEQELAVPVIRGEKTEKEKFAGAEATFTIEALMHDGKALQSGTSHYFGDGFAKAFQMMFTDKDNTLKHVYQTSFGVSTRIIGAMIMVHGDNSGLKLPPRIAPVQVNVIPVAAHKEGVMEGARALADRLKEAGIRVKLDDTDRSPGFKFAESEMRGIPLRIELGPKDLEKGECVLVRRDNQEKISVSLETVEEKAKETLAEIQSSMYERALAHREAHTYRAATLEEFIDLAENKPGFIKAMWCGDRACEDKIKELTSATSRCIPEQQEEISKTCVCCGKPAAKMVYWGKAY